MISVNGKPVAALGTVLDACHAAGVHPVTFCHDERLGAPGHCRACMVEVDGAVLASCTTPARDGAIVVTESEALSEYRRDLAELMVSDSRPAGDVGRQLVRWGADGTRYGVAHTTGRRDESHPRIHFLADRCILCRRCVTACAAIEGRFVFAIEGRGDTTQLAWGGVPFVATDCSACGACVTACPAEALEDTEAGVPANG